MYSQQVAFLIGSSSRLARFGPGSVTSALVAESVGRATSVANFYRKEGLDHAEARRWGGRAALGGREGRGRGVAVGG
jgi:hypothetical protein